jgi:hypothetical protein
VGAVACLGAALVGLGHAEPARASTRPLAISLSAHARARIWTSVRPATNAVTTVAPASEQIATFGRPIKVGHATYWLDLNVFTDGAGSYPQLDVFLIRGRPGHFQFHDYSWLRSASFTVNRRAMTARLNGGSISPSAISMHFSPTHVTSHSCALQGGGTGTYRKAVGLLSVPAFRLVTNTSPVFGTITVRPRRAELLLDPGCRSDLAGYNPRPCPQAESIDAPGLARSEWGVATNSSDTKALIDAVSPSTTFTKLQHTHIIEDTVPLADLPAPTVSKNGAMATFLTRGSLFSTGVGVFTSTRAPKVLTGSCTMRGVAHTFTTTRYRGVLSPGALPLIALFDTGHIGLAANTPAYLELSHLTSLGRATPVALPRAAPVMRGARGSRGEVAG